MLTTDHPIWRWLAWRLPRPLVYWAAIRLIAHATQGAHRTQVVPDLAAMDALQRWPSDAA
jgi:hypothetical protein